MSRAGILYINETDIGWRPFVDTWLSQTITEQTHQQQLSQLFNKYVDGTHTMTRKGYKFCTPIRLLNKVQTLVSLLEYQLKSQAMSEITPEKLESIFVFCHVWAFGGALVTDKQNDFRNRFSEDFLATFPGVRIPAKEGTVFDFWFDPAKDEHVHWRESLESYIPEPIGTGLAETPFTSLNVETVDSKRTKYLIDVLSRSYKNVMLVGTAGTGKTATIDKYLSSLDKEIDGLLSYNVVMSYYTDSAKLQVDLELPIDKRAGRIFGPPATKKLVYFIDDLNLPAKETYGTQNAIALLTQHMQHGTIFDRADLGFRKEIVDVMYIAAMNPTAGSFEVCERCQIHFATFSCSMPSTEDLQTIYEQIFKGHLNGFESAAQNAASPLVSATIKLVDRVAQRFLPTSIRFTYFWTMREMSNIFQNMCLSKSSYYTNAASLIRLWAHECRRVLSDRLITVGEIEEVNTFMGEAFKAELKTLGVAEDILAEDDEKPCIFTTFTSKETDGAYRIVPDMTQLKAVLENKLVEYNEQNPIMDLVLFDDAMRHITRISRIIANPAGNAMLIGVGGSGKQSLSKLAAFICGYETRQLAVTGTYSVVDLKEDIKLFYQITTTKDTPTIFLLTDSQIVDDRFLIYINALLSSGWVSDLLARDELDALTGSLRNDMKAIGRDADDADECKAFLIQKFRKNFKVVLAFSPVGKCSPGSACYAYLSSSSLNVLL